MSQQHWMHDLQAARIGYQGQRAYYSGPAMLPVSGARFGVVQHEEDDVRPGAGQAAGRTAFGGLPATRPALLRGQGGMPGGGVRTHMGHSHEHGSHEAMPSEGEKVVRLGFWSDIGLTIGKASGHCFLSIILQVLRLDDKGPTLDQHAGQTGRSIGPF